MTGLKQSLLALTVALSLGGCGGGVAVGLDLGYAGVYYETGPDPAYGGGYDQRPNVSVAVSTPRARTGETVRIVAAASDDYGVDAVTFYSVNAAGEGAAITTLRRPPYSVDISMPATADGVVYFTARAIDTAGQYQDSALVPVTLIP
jgi:hypothetical protein